MADKRIYNFFLFMSTLTRSLVEVFSVIFLYDMGYSVNNIFFFLLIMYVCGIFTNYVSLIINYKFVLLMSISLYGISYLYLSIMSNNFFNLVIFAVILAFSSYSYHAIRHYLAIKMLDYDKGRNINFILVVMYSAVILSNILGIILIEKLSITLTSIVIIVLSLISVVPILKLDYIKREKLNIKKVKISRDKLFFSILEQFKVILMEIQPLYLYLYVRASKYYVGMFNVVINLASLLVVMFIIKKVRKNYFRYINILLAGILLLKLNIDSSFILLIIAFFEGIGVKMFEKFSLDNLYDADRDNVSSYLMLEELVFFTSKSVIMLLFVIFVKDIKLILYLCILGIVISGFYIKDKD